MTKSRSSEAERLANMKATTPTGHSRKSRQGGPQPPAAIPATHIRAPGKGVERNEKRTEKRYLGHGKEECTRA
ncbi:hypothetical protein Q5P01_011540 [Channa striata]|uniref:Uncharacterized protein n=1 Tax=Channa striata TaxID=64152 RepID=A0AA88MTE9_CHASR|nr:hypothetical protein Q5P01_011540 [Channa striata]